MAKSNKTAVPNNVEVVTIENKVPAKMSTAPKVKSFFSKADVNEFDAHDFSDSAWFVDAHQVDEDGDDTPYSLVTMADIIDAFRRSEELMQQFAVNSKKVYEVAKSLFVHHEQLRQPISLIKLTDEAGEVTLYGFGGRHRTQAIVEFINESLRESVEREDLLKQTLVYTLVRSASTVDKVKELILADNQSRNMTGVEKAHITAQATLGIKATGATVGDFTSILTSDDLKKGEVLDFLGLMFSRLQPKGLNLKPETAKNIGRKFFAFFGEYEDDSVSKTAAIYLAAAKDAWAGIKGILADYEPKNIARSVGDIVETYIDSEEFNNRVVSGAYVAKAKTRTAKKETSAE